jgi:predicted secreted protein
MTRSKLTTAVAVCSLTLVLAAFAACGSKTSSTTTNHAAPSATFTEANNLKTFKATVGETVSVELNEARSAGYKWAAAVTPGVKIVSDSYAAPDKNATPAFTSGLHTWVLEFTQSGTQTFSATYALSSATPASPATPQIEFTFDVK